MELTEIEDVEDVEVERPLSDTLNASDRCDQCGAQAFVWVNMPGSKAGLLYCGHHFARNEQALRGYMIDYVDERYKINKKPSQSAPD